MAGRWGRVGCAPMWQSLNAYRWRGFGRLGGPDLLQSGGEGAGLWHGRAVQARALAL